MKNNHYSTNELDKFKTEIDLVGYMQKFGYTVSPRFSEGSTGNRRIAMVKGDEVLMVRKDKSSGHFIYINKKSEIDRGSIIDFLQKETSMNLGEIRRELRGYLNEPSISLEAFKAAEVKVNQVKPKGNILDQNLFAFKTLYSTKYLESRGFSPKVLYSSQFKGKIGNKVIQDSKGKEYLNTVFPIYNKEGIQGLECKNYDFKGALSGSNKSNALWFSNIPKDKSNLSFFITESAIDCIAHAQLNPNKAKELLYIATNGQITEGQINLMQELIDTHQPKAIIIGTDNDIAGERFHATLLGNLKTEQSNDTISFKVLKASKALNQLVIHTPDLKLSKNVINHINTLNNSRELTSNNELQYRNFGSTIKSELGYTSKFNFNNFKKNIDPIVDMVKLYKNHQNMIRVKAIHKDFTRDLEVSKGINIKPVEKESSHDLEFDF